MIKTKKEFLEKASKMKSPKIRTMLSFYKVRFLLIDTSKSYSYSDGYPLKGIRKSRKDYEYQFLFEGRKRELLKKYQSWLSELEKK